MVEGLITSIGQHTSVADVVNIFRGTTKMNELFDGQEFGLQVRVELRVWIAWWSSLVLDYTLVLGLRP